MMTVEAYRQMYTMGESLPGWEAIDTRLQMIYGDLMPKNFSPSQYFHEGGKDPLYAVNMFNNIQQTPHQHFISYGMSDLFYNENYVFNEFSKWGFEFTFRINAPDVNAEAPNWVIHLMNNLARHVFETQNHFEPYHFVDAQGPIQLDSKTDICGLVFDIDPELGQIITPHGKVHFLQMIGINKVQLDRIYAKPTEHTVKTIIEEIQQHNPLMITYL